MKDFLEQYKNDKQYKAKVKLIMYISFIVIVSIYAFSINGQTQQTVNVVDNPEIIEEEPKIEKISEDIIKIPDKYKFNIDININDDNYQYYGESTPTKMTITKIANGITSNYLYQNNEYFQEISGTYTEITKDEIYDIINYNYINLDNINIYLTKATLVDNEYRINLKDIIIGTDNNKYLTIKINNNNINIDYLNLMQEFNNNINKYNVNIEIEEIE